MKHYYLTQAEAIKANETLQLFGIESSYYGESSEYTTDKDGNTTPGDDGKSCKRWCVWTLDELKKRPQPLSNGVKKHIRAEIGAVCTNVDELAKSVEDLKNVVIPYSITANGKTHTGEVKPFSNITMEFSLDN